MKSTKWYEDIPIYGLFIGIIALFIELIGYILFDQFDIFERLVGIDIFKLIIVILLISFISFIFREGRTK